MEAMDPMQNQLCRVCGEPAAGFHFGAFTCEGCKSFFGRTSNNQSVIQECKNNYRCVIDKKNRTACKACRLRKCLVVGMSKSGSRYGRRSNWFKIHCLIQNGAAAGAAAAAGNIGGLDWSASSNGHVSPTATLSAGSPKSDDFSGGDLKDRRAAISPVSSSPVSPPHHHHEIGGGSLSPGDKTSGRTPPPSPIESYRRLLSASGAAAAAAASRSERSAGSGMAGKEGVPLSPSLPPPSPQTTPAALAGFPPLYGFANPFSLISPGYPASGLHILSPFLAQSHLLAARKNLLMPHSAAGLGTGGTMDVLAEHKALITEYQQRAAAAAAMAASAVGNGKNSLDSPIKDESAEKRCAELPASAARKEATVAEHEEEQEQVPPAPKPPQEGPIDLTVKRTPPPSVRNDSFNGSTSSNGSDSPRSKLDEHELSDSEEEKEHQDKNSNILNHFKRLKAAKVLSSKPETVLDLSAH